jgi:outer membrane lipoprotein SlyB
MKITARIFVIVLMMTTLAACNQDSAPKTTENTASPQETTTAVSKPPVCTGCGTVAVIEPVTVKGEGSGVGAVIGAVAGGVLGHQIGSGTGKDVATVAGAVGGAVAGHEIEKRNKAQTYYAVTVNLDQGGQTTVNLASVAGIAVGAKVEVVGNDLHLR